MRTLILASTSPRRKQLLKQLGLSFRVVASNYEEKMNPRLKPRGQAEFLSQGKAAAVYEQFKGQNVVILGADTVVDFLGETVGKPKSYDDARRMLSRIQGKSLSVITGFTLIDALNGKRSTKSVETKIHMKKTSVKDRDAYVASGEPLDRAGSFAIEEKGIFLVESIEGDYANVVGLPLSELLDELRKYTITLF